ncbi:MAG TPA: LytTR family DNA-binding domain-containing protein [Candidatus Dormibacteraeota bacterium]|nr:LytTR family DNA-binding domain-containing protein [Candidatus Dormibacteraeota bacterium]
MEPPFRALVVDDEAPARGELKYLLKQSPRVKDVLEAEGASQCMDLLADQAVDILFLDIRMPGMDGLQLSQVLAQLPNPLPVVFVTAFEGHAIEAFQLAAFDYLLKPVRADRLNLTLERLVLSSRDPAARLKGDPRTEHGALEDRLAVTHRGQILLVPVEDIRIAEVDGDRVAVITHEGRYLARLRLHDLEERLSRQGFMRVHRHYIVNLRHVTNVECFFNSTYLLRIEGVADLPVPVSRRHGPQLRSALGL